MEKQILKTKTDAEFVGYWTLGRIDEFKSCEQTWSDKGDYRFISWAGNAVTRISQIAKQSIQESLPAIFHLRLIAEGGEIYDIDAAIAQNLRKHDKVVAKILNKLVADNQRIETIYFPINSQGRPKANCSDLRYSIENLGVTKRVKEYLLNIERQVC